MESYQPEVTFNNFQPDKLAHFMVNKDWAGLWDYLMSLMDSFSVQKNLRYNIHLQNLTENEDVNSYLQNFSKLMGELLFTLLTEPSAKIPDLSYYKLVSMHEVIHNFLYVYGQGDTDALVQNILSSNKTLSPLMQKRLLLLLSMNTELDIVNILKKTDIKYREAALSAYLFYLKIFKKNVHNNKIKLMDMGHVLKQFINNFNDPKLQDSTIPSVIGTYFSCSYIDYEDKHKIKIDINNGFEKFFSKLLKSVSSRQVKPLPDELMKKFDPDKPKLLILLELYDANHAMKRSWDTWLQSLKTEFNVVLSIANSLYDENLKDQYEVITYSSYLDFLDGIQSYQPDMIIFPSVGMSFWGILGANSRLAPVQMMNLGHPASSMSKHIDFVYGQSDLYDPKAFPMDRYIIDDSPYKFTPLLDQKALDAIPTSSYQTGENRPLKVSIVGSECKTSYPFLAFLKEIEEESPFEIEFIFHLSSTGMDAHAMEDHLRSEFKNMTLYGYQYYQSFLKSIGATDIVLNPFPFGHTNTIIDTLLMGKPLVSLLGSEPSSRTEKYILRLVDLEETFQVKTKEAYKKKFFDFAERIRSGDTVFYDRHAIYDIIFTQDEASQVDYGKNIKWIYDHAEEMKKSDQKLFEVPQDI